MTAIFIVLEQEIPGFDCYVNGRALSDAERRLDRVARESGVTPLMEFFGQDPAEAAEFLEDLGSDVDESALPEQAWFPAADGIRTVAALLDYLGEHPSAIPNSTDLVAELTEWHAVLKRADAQGVCWHLEVDY